MHIPIIIYAILRILFLREITGTRTAYTPVRNLYHSHVPTVYPELRVQFVTCNHVARRSRCIEKHRDRYFYYVHVRWLRSMQVSKSIPAQTRSRSRFLKRATNSRSPVSKIGVCRFRDFGCSDFLCIIAVNESIMCFHLKSSPRALTFAAAIRKFFDQEVRCTPVMVALRSQ